MYVEAFYTGWGLVEMAANYYSDVLQEAKVAVFFPSTQSKYIFRRSKSLQRLSAREI